MAALDTQLAGVMLAAMREVFDRDARRLELEREQVQADRARAERALRLELRRQAAEREIGRLRLLTGVASVGWLGTLFLAARVVSNAGSNAGLTVEAGAVGPRLALGTGWALLLAGLAATVAAQARVARDVACPDDVASSRDAIGASAAGLLALGLIVAGFAVVGVAVLVG